MLPSRLNKIAIALSIGLSFWLLQDQLSKLVTTMEDKSLTFADTSPSPAHSLNQDTLNVWFTKTQETGSVRAKRNEVYEAIIHEYNQQTKIPVDYEIKPSQNWNEFIKQQGENSNLPCVFEVDAPLSYEYIEKGWLAPINLPATIKTDLIPSILEQGTYKNNFYLIGLYDVGLGLWGNKALIDQANQKLIQENKPTIKIPENLDRAWSEAEFIYALKALKQVTSRPPMNIQLHYGSNSEWLTYGFLPILQSYGGDIVDRTNYRATGTLDSQLTTNIFKKLQGWMRNGYLAGSEDKDSFEKGEAALSYVGTWKYEYAKAAIGEDNLVLIPMPKFGENIVVGMGTWAWAISESCPNKIAAIDFIIFMLKSDNLRLISDRTGLIPARKTAAKGSVFYDEQGQLYLLYQQILESAKPRPKTPYYPIITRNFRQGTYGILAEMKDVEILKTIAETIDNEIDSYNQKETR